MKNDFEVRGEVAAIFLKHKGVLYETLVDTANLPKVNNFRNTFFLHNGYVEGRYFECKKAIYISLHRLILDFPDDLQVDHINHNPLDNRRSNLRVVTLQENSCNKKGARADNITSGHRGVSWNSGLNKWIVQVRVKGELKYKRLFDEHELEDAKNAAEQARAYYMPTSSDARMINQPEIEKYELVRRKKTVKSGHRNVYWNERSKSWKVEKNINNVRKFYGYFKELSDAVEVAKALAK